MAGKPIVISILANASQANKTFDTTASRAQKVGAGFKKMALPAVAALGAIGAASLSAAKAAAEDDASQSKLAQTLKTAASASKAQVSATEDWITAQGKALGVADDELRPALGKLAVATGDVGKAQKLAALAMDVSAGSGKDLNQVTEALVKAQNGSLGGLSRLGVKTKDAAGKTLSLKKVTQDLAATYKGAASTAADTTAGKQKKLQVQMGELQEQIGAKLLPVLTKFATVGLAAVQWISDNETTVLVMVSALAALASVVLLVNGAMQVASAASTVYGVAQKVMEANTKRAAAGQWALNTSLLANPVVLIVAGVVALAAALVIAYKKSETFRKIVDGAFRGVHKAAAFAFNWVKSNWPLLLAIITGPIGLAVLAVVKNWDRIKAGAGAAKNFIVDKFTALVSFVTGLPGRIGRGASGMFDGIRDAFKGAINWIIDKWNGLSFSLPGVSIPGLGKVGGFTLSTPNIPRLAAGGITTGPMLAMIGDNPGGREAVIPLDKYDLGGTTNIYVSVQAPVGSSSAEIGRELTRHLRAFAGAGGRVVAT